MHVWQIASRITKTALMRWVSPESTTNLTGRVTGERKVVIISTCVDNNPLRASDPHFINVACSRDQHLLIVVGNFSGALSPNEDWNYVKRQGQEIGSWIEHHVKTGEFARDNYKCDIKPCHNQPIQPRNCLVH